MDLLIVAMDTTLVNVAIPSIRKDLGATPAQLQWAIDLYTLVVASLFILAGVAGDRFGRRRIFQIGLTIFAVGSLLCSLAPGIQTLLAARLVQGIGGSMMNPTALSIVSQVFTGRVERARALGVWGGVVGISMLLAATVGGLLIHLVGWRAVFWVNLPICVVAIVMTAAFVPESRSASTHAIDPFGQALAVVFLFGLVYVLIEGPRLGWASSRFVTIGVVAALAIGAFLFFESRHRDPFIDLRFFRSVPFSSATLTAISAFAAWGAWLFMMLLYLQEERHYSAMRAGLMYLVPSAVGALVFSPLSGRLVGRFGARPSLVSAGALITVASLTLTLLTANTPAGVLLTIFLLSGIGFAMVNPPITNAAVSGMPSSRAGAASAITSTSRQVGVSIGVALSGSLTGGVLARVGSDFATSTRPLWYVCAGLGALITMLGVVSTSSWAARSAQRLAPLIDEPAPKWLPVGGPSAVP
jgi:EmrB/QacA subfamily drug resistance transporter